MVILRSRNIKALADGGTMKLLIYNGNNKDEFYTLGIGSRGDTNKQDFFKVTGDTDSIFSTSYISEKALFDLIKAYVRLPGYYEKTALLCGDCKFFDAVKSRCRCQTSPIFEYPVNQNFGCIHGAMKPITRTVVKDE